MESTKQIRKELAILIKEKHKTCVTESERNKVVNDVRQEINIKYGKGWRDRDLFKPYDNENTKFQSPSIYDGHVNGEHWMD